MYEDNKLDRITALYDSWKDCTRCGLCKPVGRHRGHVVFGDGDANAKLVIIGDSPGEWEDLSGIPFGGRRGEIIDEMLQSCGSSRDEVFIIHIVGCSPSEDGDPSEPREPRKDELKACLERVYEILRIIDPYVVLIIGQTALKALTKSTSIKKLAMNKFHPGIDVHVPGVMVPLTWQGFATYSPDHLLRNWSLDPGGDVHVAWAAWQKAFLVVDTYNEHNRGIIAPQRTQDV